MWYVRILWNVGAWAFHRIAAFVAVVIYAVPFCLVLVLSRKERNLEYYVKRVVAWFRTPPDVNPVGRVILFPRSWRSDPLNWVEGIYIAICWLWLMMSLRYVAYRTYRHRRPGFYEPQADIINAGTLLMWVRMLGFLKEYRNLAPFVILLTKTVFHDLKVFFVILGILFFGFTHTLYNSAVLNKDFYQNHSYRDGNSGIAQLGIIMEAVYTYILTGEGNDGDGLRTPDRIYVIAITFMMLVVVLNVLIALVIESYEDAMQRASQLFWYSRFEMVAKTIALHGDHLAKGDVPRETIEAILNDELADACHDTLFSTHLKQRWHRS